MMTLYGLLWAAGGNDILALVFHLNLNYITYFMRVAIFILPVVAFIIARRWCISLQRQDEARLLHGYETGIIMRSPEGAYAERHLPISNEEAYTLTARDRDEVYEVPAGTDANGVPAPNARAQRLRAKLSKFWFADTIQKPTREELEAAHHHAEHELAVQSDGHQHLPAGDYLGPHELDGHAADGHQFDGRHSVEGEELRKH
jgi:ubiquinol-cytochrome c reductase cytochrome b subunit